MTADGKTSNVDDWDKHWTEHGEASEIGPAPKYRRRLIMRLVHEEGGRESLRMLEIGSGTGEFAEDFCARYPLATYLGLELSRTGVKLSERRVPGAKFLQRDLLRPQKSDFFEEFNANIAVCSEVLEHLEDPEILVRNASRYMASGCTLIVTVPSGPMNAFYEHIGHRHHYRAKEMAELLESCGFQTEKTLEAGFPFYDLFRLFLTIQGKRLIKTVSGPPTWLTRLGMYLFNFLFRLNLSRRGWQTIVVSRYMPKP